MKDLNKLKEEIAKYTHVWRHKVQFSHVDSFKVVHNLQYLYFLEWARTEYLQAIGVQMNDKTFTDNLAIMTVHHNVNYFASLKFFDEFKVLSRISEVGKSSLVFNNLILKDDNTLILQASVVMVNVEPQTQSALKLDEDIRAKILNYEKDNVIFKV